MYICAVALGRTLTLNPLSPFPTPSHIDSSPTIAGFFISACNGGLPAFLKALNETEEHLTQGSRQTSLLLKLVLSRWMTAAIVIWLIRGFENTLKESFMTKAAAVLFADAFTTPILRLMDIGGRLGRHYSAKSAKTQEKVSKERALSFFLLFLL